MDTKRTVNPLEALATRVFNDFCRAAGISSSYITIEIVDAEQYPRIHFEILEGLHLRPMYLVVVFLESVEGGAIPRNLHITYLLDENIKARFDVALENVRTNTPYWFAPFSWDVHNIRRLTPERYLEVLRRALGEMNFRETGKRLT